MKRILAFLSIAIFSIFIGSQITEGFLLVPHWKSLSTTDFYEYYSKFGKTIGQFYTILTVISALIPISISVYCFRKKSPALKHALFSSFLILLCIAFFYIYFKDVNQQFYNASLSATELKSELKTWEYWHWSRVILEFLSLIFLMLSLNILTKKRILKS
ncbi:MAG: hypothetical protein AB8B78_03420 [Polaribacter sp.]